MFKEFAIVNDMAYIVDDEYNIKKYYDNGEWYNILTLLNKLECCENKSNEFRQNIWNCTKKGKKYYFLMVISFLSFFWGLIFSLKITSIVSLLSFILFSIKRNKAFNSSFEFKKNLYSIERDISDYNDELSKCYFNLKMRGENLLPFLNNCGNYVDKNEYDNISNKHIVSIETDFSQDYDKLSRDVKVRRKEKRSNTSRRF